MNSHKPLVGALAIGAGISAVILASGYANYREVKQAEYMQLQTQMQLQQLKATPSPSASPSAIPTPSKYQLPKSPSPTLQKAVE